MATSGLRSTDDEEVSVECLMKWTLEYVNETKEYLCGWCGQVLIPNLTTEELETHFKSCKESKNDGLGMVFKELRKISKNFQDLKADISEIQKKVDTTEAEVKGIKADVSNMKTEINNEILALKTKCEENHDGALATLFNKVNVLETGMKEKMREMGSVHQMKIAEVNGRVSGVSETISNVIHSVLEGVKRKDEAASSADRHELAHLKKVTEDLSEQVKTNDGDLRVIKTQLKDEQEKNEAAKKIKSFHVEPSAVDQLTITMNCFNLVAHNYLFQPSFRWIINGIAAILTEKTLELSSEMFQWNGYPVQARAKLQPKEDDCTYISLCLRDVLKDESDPKDFTPISQVFYLLKDKNARNPRHKCRSQFYLLNTEFDYSLDFDRCFVHKSWLKNSTYNVADSVEIEIYVEPSPMTQQVHSQDGTLDWVIENYSRRLQLEKDNDVFYQESPYFYTGPDGYRVRVRMKLYAAAGGGPTAQITFLNGKFDAELPDTFPHSTTVTLVNPKEPARSVNKTIVEDIESKYQYSIEICKLEEVQEFIENDSLIFKVIIESLSK